MTTAQIGVLGLVSVAFSLTVFALLENPLGWRKPRQRQGGIFHRLGACLRCWVRCVSAASEHARARMSTRAQERGDSSGRRQP
jgi:hypothetical protein